MELHACTPVGGRLAQFAHNWKRLTGDQWVLLTVQGYQLPLNQWPQCGFMHVVTDRALKVEVAKLVKKGAVVPVDKSKVHIASPFLLCQKIGGGWCPIIDLRHLNQYPISRWKGYTWCQM